MTERSTIVLVSALAAVVVVVAVGLDDDQTVTATDTGPSSSEDFGSYDYGGGLLDLSLEEVQDAADDVSDDELSGLIGPVGPNP